MPSAPHAAPQAISKLHTPRELMIMMTELLARLEANQDAGSATGGSLSSGGKDGASTFRVAAQDMEIAVAKAMEQAV